MVVGASTQGGPPGDSAPPEGATPSLSAAEALAGTPFFSELSAVDLARIVPELEEYHYPPGDVVFCQGDPPDGLYLIRSGTAEVTVLEERGVQTVSTLEAPAHFGEGALLTDEPRSTSVVAATPLAVWKLPRDRFDALVDNHPRVLRELAAGLAGRLTEATRKLSASQEQTLAAARATYGSLDPTAQALLRRTAIFGEFDISLLRATFEEHWSDAGFAKLVDEAVFFRAAERSGWYGFVQNTLRGFLQHQLRAEVGSRELRRLRRHAVEQLQAQEDPPTEHVIDLLHAAEDWPRLADLLETRGDELVGHAPGQVEGHLRALPSRLLRSRPLLTRLLAACCTAQGKAEQAEQAEEATSLNASPRSPNRVDDGAERGWGSGLVDGCRSCVAGMVTGVQVGSRSARVWMTIGVLLLTGLAWLVPPPAGLSAAGFRVLATIAALVALGFLDILPEYLLGLVVIAAWVVTGTLPPEIAVSGFANATWFLLVASMAIGTAVARSGLLYRGAIELVRRLPASHRIRCVTLGALGVAFTPGMPSVPGRVMLAVPLAQDISDTLRYPERSGGSAGLAFSTYVGFGMMGTLFLTGSPLCLIAFGLLPAEVQAQMSWGRWFVSALPTHLVLFGLTIAFILFRYRPEGSDDLPTQTLALQRRVLGPLSRDEWSALAVLAALLVGFSTQTIHGIDPAWLAVAAVAALFLAGALDDTSFKQGVNVSFLLYLGVILGFGQIFAHVGLHQWLGQHLEGITGLIGGRATVFLAVVAVIAALAGVLLRPGPIALLLGVALYPTAAQVGVSPWVVAVTVMLASNLWLYPQQNILYQSAYWGTGERAFSHDQARPLAFAYACFVLISVLVSIPYWRWLGLIA